MGDKDGREVIMEDSVGMRLSGSTGEGEGLRLEIPEHPTLKGQVGGDREAIQDPKEQLK